MDYSFPINEVDSSEDAYKDHARSHRSCWHTHLWSGPYSLLSCLKIAVITFLIFTTLWFFASLLESSDIDFSVMPHQWTALMHNADKPVPSPWSLEPTLHWKPTPEYRACIPSVCGTWHKQYQEFHASVASGSFFLDHFIRTGQIPEPPLIIFQINPELAAGGISDRWPIVVTTMMVALITQRAIFFDWPEMTAAYTFPHLPYLVNTTHQQVYARWLFYKQNLNDMHRIRDQNLAHVNDSAFTPLPYPEFQSHVTTPISEDHSITGRPTKSSSIMFARAQVFQWFILLTESVDQVKQIFAVKDRPIVFLTAYQSAGMTHEMFTNPILSTFFHDLGLKQQSAHGCIINFLLGLNHQVETMFEPFAKQLLDPTVLSVGLQIRMGDFALRGREQMNERQRHDLAWQTDPDGLARHLTPFFECAKQLADSRRDRLDQKIIFFIVSDDLDAKKFIQNVYRKRVDDSIAFLMIPTEGEAGFVIGHTDRGDSAIFNNGSRQTSDQADLYLRMAAGEQWLLAYSDYLVIDNSASGFGRSAALRSMKVSTAFDGRSQPLCNDGKHHLTVDDWMMFGHKY